MCTQLKTPWTRQIHKYLLFLVINTLFVAKLAAFQVVTSDSLWASWHNKGLTDTSRMNALLAICRYPQYIHSKPDSVVYYAEQGAAFAQLRKHPIYVARFLRVQGYALRLSNKYYEAEDVMKRALTLADSLNDAQERVECLNQLGTVYNMHSDYVQAMDCFHQALALAEQLDQPKLVTSILGNLGNAYQGMEDYDKAISYHQRALRLDEQLLDTGGIIQHLDNISLAYTGQKNYPKALEALTRALQMSKAAHATWMQATLYMNIGDVYYLLHENMLATNNFYKALSQYQMTQNKLGEAEVAFRLARSYQKQYPDSTFVLGQRALTIAQQMDKRDLLVLSAKLLSETYESLGQYRPALHMYQLYHQTQDSIRNGEQQKSVFLSETKYACEKKQLEDKIRFEQQLAQNELSQQRGYYLLMALICLVLLGGYLLFRHRDAQFQQEKAALLLTIDQLREQTAKQAFLPVVGSGEKVMLNKKKIEKTLGIKLGETSWNILELLADNPTISNQEIAALLFLSEEGVSSSLRRMYTMFDIQPGNSKNHKISLLTKAAELSVAT